MSMSPEERRIAQIAKRLEREKRNHSKVMLVWSARDRQRRNLEAELKRLEQELENLRQGQLILMDRAV